MPDIIHQYEPLWGSWYVDAPLGSGSFGKVYRVRMEEFGQTHYSAVKIISVPHNEQELEQLLSEGYDEASARSYFHAVVSDMLQEIRLMSQFRGNSNIVSFEDYKVLRKEGSICWDILIRMELLTSLTKRLQDHAITQRDVITMGIHICRALELCAQKNIIHRDIKPENIFVSPFGEFKLGDFGIARQMERTTTEGSLKGTYTYMAPEVLRREKYNATVDQYSLGIVMYRLLNQNRLPFSPPYPQVLTPREREEALMRRMNGEPIPPIPDIDPTLNAAMLKACAFDRKKRFHDANEMRQVLETALQGKGLQPGKDKPVTTRQGEHNEHSGQSGNQRKSTALEGSITMPLLRSDTPLFMRDARLPPKNRLTQAKHEKQPNRRLTPLIVVLSVLLLSIVTFGVLWIGGVIGPYASNMPEVAEVINLPEDTQHMGVTDEQIVIPIPTPTLTSAPTHAVAYHEDTITPLGTPIPMPTPTPTSIPTPTPTPTPMSTSAPTPIPAPLLIPTLSSGFIINQPRDQRHDVYTGPGKNYFRVKVKKTLVYVSTNGWIKAYARDGDWLLVEYEINSGVNRMGYVARKNSKNQEIRDFYTVSELSKANLSIRITRSCAITDDPNESERALFEIPENLTGILLCNWGKWGYIELTINGETVRGFVDSESFALD